MRRLALLLALMLVGRLTTEDVLHAQSPGERWRTVTSPQGRFTIQLSEGWGMQPDNPYESRVRFSPGGRSFPSVSVIGWVTAWDLNFQRTRLDDFRLFCRQVSAHELYAQILLPIVRQSVQDAQIDQMLPSHPSPQARVEGSLTYQGQPARFLDVVSMEYVADPSEVRCSRAWHSYAFIGSLVASPQQMPALVPVAERIWSTFAPNSLWGAEEREELFRGIQTRPAMIGQTLNNVARMEMNQRIQEMQSFRRTGQGWIDTLGGVSRYKDPKDPTYEGTIPWSKIPSGTTRLWRCGLRQEPMYANTSPGPGCQEIPPAR